MKMLTDVISGLLLESAKSCFPDVVEDKDIQIQFTKDLNFGDFQTNLAMILTKKAKRNPREIASLLVENLPENRVIEKTEIAGPGFLNFFVNKEYLSETLTQFSPASWNYEIDLPEGITVIDYSSPNIAKRMHIGHLRSTIIGDSIKRICKFLGHNIIADNHLGDWGTQFGKLIVGYHRWLDKDVYDKDPIGELERIYVKFEQESQNDEELLPLARTELKKVQDGDPANLALWKEFVDLSLVEYNRLYERMDISFDTYWGESIYNDIMPEVVDTLLDKKIAQISEGAVVVFFDESESLHPCLIRKSDGAFLYATSDLACIKKKMEAYDLHKLIYVTDDRQNDHFKQFFKVSEKLGWDVNPVHVPFGIMKFAEGHFSSRKGNVIRLETLLDEAEARALKIVEEKNPGLPSDEKNEIARVVGIGAVKYADLSQNRTSTIIFDWDKVLSFEGNTAPYLQYVYARINSIFRKAEAEWSVTPENYVYETEQEKKVLLHLLKFHGNVAKAAESCKPNVIADYIFELAQFFNSFYNAVNILKSEGELKTSRLFLARQVADTIQSGLNLLGIEVVKRM